LRVKSDFGKGKVRDLRGKSDLGGNFKVGSGKVRLGKGKVIIGEEKSDLEEISN
jgi:hypothetical protein